MTEADDLAPVLSSRHGAVTVLTLNRPRQRNALIWESWQGIDAQLDTIEDDGVRAVVIAGSGGFFSAGGDRRIRPARGVGPLAPAARLEIAHRVLSRIQSCPVPVVACVEGGAIGIAWSLVLCCDLVVAAGDAYFSAPFLSVGVPPDGGAAWLLTQRLGRAKASEIILTSARVSAQDAAALGLVSRVTEPGAALAGALELATSISAADPAAVELAKRLLACAEQSDLPTFLALELTVAATAQRIAALREGSDNLGEPNVQT